MKGFTEEKTSQSTSKREEKNIIWLGVKYSVLFHFINNQALDRSDNRWIDYQKV